MAVRNGRENVIKIGSDVVGEIRTMSLDGNQTTIDVSSKSTGDFVKRIPDRKDWVMNLTVLADDEETDGQGALIDAWLNKTKVTVSFGPETPTAGEITFTGDVHVTNFSVSDDDGAAGEISFTLEGTETLTKNTAA